MALVCIEIMLIANVLLISSDQREVDFLKLWGVDICIALSANIIYATLSPSNGSLGKFLIIMVVFVGLANAVIMSIKNEDVYLGVGGFQCVLVVYVGIITSMFIAFGLTIFYIINLFILFFYASVHHPIYGRRSSVCNRHRQ